MEYATQGARERYAGKALFWINAFGKLLFSPMGMIALAAPSTMQIITNTVKVSLDVPVSDLNYSILEATRNFIEATTTANTYECAWFDMKMQAYAFVAAFIIGLVEYFRITFCISVHPELEFRLIVDTRSKVQKLALVLGWLYFFLMFFYATSFFSSNLMNLSLIGKYLPTCAGARFLPPGDSPLTWFRASIILPAIAALVFNKK